MIQEKAARKYCREDISLIENYDKAIADKDVMWHCHHRDEVKVLPSGIVAIRTQWELRDDGRYFGCPANELIFLTPSEHHSLHAKYLYLNISDETRERMSKSARKRKTNYWKGRKKSAEHLEKMAKTRRGMVWSDFGMKFKEHYGETHATAPRLYFNEKNWYNKHNKICRWEVEDAR